MMSPGVGWRLRPAEAIGSASEAACSAPLAVFGLLVPRPLPRWDNGHSVLVRWDRFANAAAAWGFAKQFVGW